MKPSENSAAVRVKNFGQYADQHVKALTDMGFTVIPPNRDPDQHERPESRVEATEPTSRVEGDQETDSVPSAVKQAGRKTTRKGA